ncbi:autorepressor SdpR family transcription factor [Ectobacillus funiculus]
MNETFKALSDPTRRAILDLLKERDKTAGEIAEHFHITKPSVSHHLSGLKKTQILCRMSGGGQFIYYSLNTTVLQDVMKWLLDVSNKTEGKDEQ